MICGQNCINEANLGTGVFKKILLVRSQYCPPLLQTWGEQNVLVPHLRGFHYLGSHYCNFCLMYTQVGDFRISRGLHTVPLTQILRKAGTLCISSKRAIRYLIQIYEFHSSFYEQNCNFWFNVGRARPELSCHSVMRQDTQKPRLPRQRSLQCQ